VTKFFCVPFVLCGLAFRAVALDRHAFTFTHYDLNARIEQQQQRLGVRGKITLRNDSDAPQKNLALQISSSLNWLSIQFEGKPVEFVSQPYTSDIDHTGALTEAIIVLPRAVAPKQTIELEVGYEGTVPQDATRLTRIGVPAGTAKHSDWDRIGRTFSAVRGIGYVAWYPIATEAASLADGDSVFEEVGRWKQRETGVEMATNFAQIGEGHPPQLFCNGVQERHMNEQISRAYNTSSQCNFLLTPSRAPVFLIGNYDKLEKPTVNISYLPQHKSGADDYSLAVEQVTPLVSKWFGDHRDTQNTKAELIDLPDPEAAPFESGNMLLLPLTTDETTMLLSAVRQLTHLYSPSARAWIREGLSAYAQVNYVQEEKGRDAALIYLQSHRGAFLQEERDTLTSGSDGSLRKSLLNATDELYVQTKAMNVWWMLRDIVGEPALSAALHNYNARDDNDPRDMQKLVEAQSHRDLTWFFDDWVYNDRGLPNLRIRSVYPRAVENGTYLTTVTVENVGTAGAEIPVTAHMEKGDSSERLVVPAKSKASVRIVTPAPPREIRVNDGSVPESETTTHVYKIEANH
jgi:hypothetical protein